MLSPLLPQHLLWSPRDVSGERQIHKYAGKPCGFASFAAWQGEEISCKKPLSPPLKASSADLQRDSWIPSSALPTPGHLAGDLCLHVPCRTVASFPGGPVTSLMGIINIPQTWEEEWVGGHRHTRKLFLASP